MDSKIQKILLVISLLAIAIIAIMFFQYKTPNTHTPSEKLNVVVSFYPLEYLVSMVGGDRVVVTDLTPPGIEPHEFEPSPRDIQVLNSADLFIYNGGIEPWVPKWITGEPRDLTKIVSVTDALKAKDVELISRDGATDPHVWLDPSIMKKETEIVRDHLILADPASRTVYEENAVKLIAILDALDVNYRQSLSKCENHNMVVSHDAFSYLARAYGLSVISIAGISPDEEPSTKTLAAIADLARERNIKYIFFEAIANPKLSATIAREVGAETLVLNTLESLTDSELVEGKDYVLVMEQNLNNLRKAFICQ